MEHNRNNKKVEINILMYLYVIYIISIIVNDYIIYTCGSKHKIITYGISIIIVASILFFIRNKINVTKVEFQTIDVVFIIIFVGLFILRVAIPENAFDTVNYHLILQENPFSSYINNNFFPGRNINTFSYPLGDRMFFPFRKLLGYRLGLILNLGVIILIYYKVKEILTVIMKVVLKNNTYSKIIPIISFLSIYSEKIYEIVCIYYIDILYIPLFFELIKIILLNKREEYNKYNNIYIGILSGIIVSLKITNILFIVPMYIIYLFINFKKIQLRDYVCLICIPILPIFIYTLNIFIQTGSPVFPYYNKIFKSKYFSEVNWVDIRFGPKNIAETILWPIIIYFKPNRTDDLAIYSGRLSLAFIISIVYIIYCLIKCKFSWSRLKENFKFNIIIVFIMLNYIWTKFMVGYIRYALVLEVTSVLVISITIVCLLNKSEKKNVNSWIAYILLIFMSINILMITKETFMSNKEWAWRYPFYNNLALHKDNMKYLFKDRTSGIDKSQLDAIQCWGIVDYNSGYARLVKSDIPIISLNASVSNDLTRKKLDDDIKRYNNAMYTIVENDKINKVFDELNKQGFAVCDNIIKIKPYFISSDKALYLIKIRKNGLVETKNEYITINNDKKEYAMDLSKFSNKNIKFSCIGGISPIIQGNGSDGFNLDFYIISNESRQKIYTKKVYTDSNLDQIKFDIDLNKYGSQSKLVITFSNDQGQNGNADWAAIVNPIISID